MINADARALIERWPLGFVASVTAEGWPAVSPKGTFLVLDERTLGFGDIRSPGTLRNLAKTPRLEVNFIDFLVRKGVRVQGTTRILEKDSADFARLHGKWVTMWGALAERIRALVLIDVTRVGTFSTPPYGDGATEDEMIALYKSKIAEMYP